MLKKGAGILLPISSLPSPYGIGTMGRAAYHFIDQLASCGQTYWQVLPIGPTSYGDSPYQSFSAFAGNPYFIDLDKLIEDGLLSRDEVLEYDFGSDNQKVDYGKLFAGRFKLLYCAYKKNNADKEFEEFCNKNADWLDDYALFMALKEHFNNKEWLQWDEDIRLRRKEAIEYYRMKLIKQIGFWKFCQFKFYSQWRKLKTYANEKGVLIIGDIPIYVALDSSDVWVNSQLFQLDERRNPVCVAGVPPDEFSSAGQLWGNPLYDWDAMERDGFSWWSKRIKHCSDIYDCLRIDHFIGISRYFSIPAGSKTAIGGQWRIGPGKKLTDVIDGAKGKACIIVEDLGVLHESVIRLLKETGYPGMRVMQFGFDGDPNNQHLSRNFTSNVIAYGGTHDNETIVGAYKNRSNEDLAYILNYLQISKKEQIPWAMLEAAYASPAVAAIFQMQDILELDNTSRMNTPSTLGGNWCWRLKENQFNDEHCDRLRKLVDRYNRR